MPTVFVFFSLLGLGWLGENRGFFHQFVFVLFVVKLTKFGFVVTVFTSGGQVNNPGIFGRGSPGEWLLPLLSLSSLFSF